MKIIKGSLEESGQVLRCPLSLFIDVVDPIAIALDKLKNETTKALSVEIQNVFTSRFASLDDKDIKDIQRSTIDKICNLLEWVKAANSTDSRHTESIHSFVFGMSLQLLKSSYLKKKLLGLSLIREMLPKSTRDRLQATDKTSSGLEWKDSRAFVNAIMETKLLDIILGENASAEILRKSEDIFQFVLIHNKLEVKHIDCLWKCCTNKHEDIMRECLLILTHLINKMPRVLLQDLFAKIETLTSYSEIIINFLSIYTMIIVSQSNEKEVASFHGSGEAQAPVSAPAKLYNLDIFWNLLLDTSQVQGKLKDQAMSALISIIIKYNDLAGTYISKAIDCIKGNQTVVRCIQFLKEIDFATIIIKTDKKKRVTYDLLELDKDNSILINAIKDCEAYHKKVRLDLLTNSGKKKDLMNEVCTPNILV